MARVYKIPNACFPSSSIIRTLLYVSKNNEIQLEWLCLCPGGLKVGSFPSHVELASCPKNFVHLLMAIVNNKTSQRQSM
jgi:hypothetical protein